MKPKIKITTEQIIAYAQHAARTTTANLRDDSGRAHFMVGYLAATLETAFSDPVFFRRHYLREISAFPDPASKSTP